MTNKSGIFASLNTKLQALAESKRIFAWVVVLSFLESTFVPLPLEAILIPLMYSCRRKVWTFAAAALVGCLAGASLGYSLGAMFFDSIAAHISHYLGSPEQLEQVMQKIQQDGFIYVLAVGVTPVPFQLAMLAAGAVQYSFLLFLVATLIARGIRYFGLAALIYYFGEAATDIIKRYKYQTASILSLGFAAFIVVKFNLL